jgi:sialate O-acetylesterase
MSEKVFVAAAALALLAFAPVRAEVTLAAPFRDGAVLQRGKPVPVWGRADAGEAVQVEFAGQFLRTIANADGRWRVDLAPLATSAQPGTLVVTASNVVRVADVLVGEVWLCSGQSNMNMAVRQAQEADKEIAAADFPLIRHFVVQSQVADAPVEMASGEWKSATPEHVGAFTAAGYFFARELHRELGVPIGIMKSTLGGSPIEGWLSVEALASDPAFSVVGPRWEELKPKVEKGNRNQPAGLYNGLIHPLEPYALAGFLWYQGEGNSERAGEYEKLFSAMIRQWRRDFAQGDLPFIFAQLPKWEPNERARGQDWPALRAAQAAVAAKVPNTFMAVTLDAGDRADLHPKNKQAVGRRLALLALAKVYGRTIEFTGPQFARADATGSGVRLTFAHADGLRIEGDPAAAFEIAGPDGKFEPALAFEDGNSLWVESGRVTEPVAVRHAWRNCPESYVFNKAGLPAAPFEARIASRKALARFPVPAPPAGTPQTMWRTDELFAAPTTFPVSEPGFADDGEIRPVFFAGEPWKGRPTKVFAWIGVPRQRSGKVPGMVLVHGGGGAAYKYWAKTWVDRGYAVIAMDTSGSMPPDPGDSRAVRGRPHAEGGPTGWGNFEAALEPPREQWMYHAVAAVIRAHSLLRSLPEVDVDRIGLNGISWGGIITCIVAGVDARFKLAVPVYGCGFLGENSFFLETSLQSISPDKAKRWVELWDPSQHVGRAGMPMFFVNGTNDKHFRPVVWQKTYEQVRSPVTLSLQPGLRHGHPPTGDPKEIAVYVDSILRGGVPLPTILGTSSRDAEATVQFRSSVAVKSVDLVYTTDGAGWPAREWRSVSAELSTSNGTARATIPEGTTAWFFNVRDERGCVVSSPHVETGLKATAKGSN